jgi:hemolysin III
MTSHIVGGAFGVAVLSLCTVFAAIHRNWWGLAGGIVYGLMMIFLYTISSVYHGLIPEKPKKVMQVLDHCTIFALIFGTYIPVCLRAQGSILPLFGLVGGC